LNEEHSQGPRLYVVSAPSGGGKTSLVNALLERDDRVTLSVSHTTRPPRPGEVDGVHYYFVDDDAFSRLAAADAFLEHAEVFGRRYGTGRAAVEQRLADGFDVLLDIDWQGARQIRRNFPSCRTIFIVPPSLEELRRRLTARGQDTGEVIQRRMRAARAEISHWDEFDFLVVNDRFDDALADLHSIIRRGHPEREADEDAQRELLADLLETR
jgi:guanylate kinase